MRIAVIVHVFYPESWPELARCIRNIDGDRDLFVTFVDETAVEGARRDFPDAHLVRCENRRPSIGLVADRHVIMRRRDVPIARTRETSTVRRNYWTCPSKRCGTRGSMSRERCSP